MELDNILSLAKSLGGIFIAVFYVAIVLWTYKDARRRIDDPILVATSVATSMLPVVGVFVYMLLRPPEYIADVRERELEIRAMERTLGRQERCPYCKSHIEGDYLSCPVCMTKLRQACSGCERPLDPRWAMCPYCETEVPRSQREVPRSPRGGASPRPGSSRESAVGRQTAEPRRKPEPRRASSRTSSRPAEPKPKRTSGKDKDSSSIETEPFAGASRFVRDSGPARPLIGSDQPTMVTPGPGRPDPR